MELHDLCRFDSFKNKTGVFKGFNLGAHENKIVISFRVCKYFCEKKTKKKKTNKQIEKKLLPETLMLYNFYDNCGKAVKGQNPKT